MGEKQSRLSVTVNYMHVVGWKNISIATLNVNEGQFSYDAVHTAATLGTQFYLR
jgi:hypothetical protein